MGMPANNELKFYDLNNKFKSFIEKVGGSSIEVTASDLPYCNMIINKGTTLSLIKKEFLLSEIKTKYKFINSLEKILSSQLTNTLKRLRPDKGKGNIIITKSNIALPIYCNDIFDITYGNNIGKCIAYKMDSYIETPNIYAFKITSSNREKILKSISTNYPLELDDGDYIVLEKNAELFSNKQLSFFGNNKKIIIEPMHIIHLN
jgi:hypothetical protein